MRPSPPDPRALTIGNSAGRRNLDRSDEHRIELINFGQASRSDLHAGSWRAHPFEEGVAFGRHASVAVEETERRLGDGPFRVAAIRPEPVEDDQIGLGVGMYDSPVGVAYGHNGRIVGYHAGMRHDPERDFTAIVLGNDGNAPTEELVSELLTGLAT